MSSWQWESLSLAILAWPAALLFAFLVWRELRSRGDLARFISTTMQTRLVSRLSAERRTMQLVAIGFTLFFGVAAMMRPQEPGVVRQTTSSRVSADIVVALDVSRSMLAEDAAPNRLARAKSEIHRMLDKLAGHRVSLVAFAGKASILSPLTPDYGFFRLMLRGANPKSVSRGGTALGEAIRTSLDAFDEDGGAASRVLLLITDGEDHESYPEEAAKAAKEAGVTIVAIGLGSDEGSQILITDPETGVQEPVRDREGNLVITKIDSKLLETIAVTTEGVFVPAKVDALDLESIVDKHIKPIFEDAEVKASRAVPDELYPILILLALVSLVASVAFGIRPSARKSYATRASDE